MSDPTSQADCGLLEGIDLMPRVEQQAPSLTGLVEELRSIALAERVRRRRDTLY